MTQIGEFTRNETGFSGRIQTFALDVGVNLVSLDPSEAENAPDYRLHLGDDDAAPEVGAAWKRTGEKAGGYFAVLIDDPVLPQPIRANLFQNGTDPSSWSLHWNRPPKRDGRD